MAAFVVVPLTMGVWGPLVRKLRRGDRRVLDLAGEVNAHILETLSGIRLVKASGAERHERARFRALTGDYFRTFVRTERLRALAAPLTEMLAAIGTVVLLGYGARLVLIGGELTAEAFIGFIALSTKLYAPIKYLSKLPALVLPGLAGAERVFEFLDAPIEIRDRAGARPFPRARARAAFRGGGLHVPTGAPRARGNRPGRAEGECGGAGGSERRREEHAGGPGHALPRPNRGTYHRGRGGRTRVYHRLAARRSRSRVPRRP